MSPTARRRLYRPFRRTCVACLEQPALFQYRGRVRADRDHTLCFRCFRAEVERLRARRLAERVVPARPSGGPGRTSVPSADLAVA